MAYFDRGIIRLNQKDTTGACEDWNKALELGYRDAQREVQQYCRH
jgi:predicted negative regulator of RcsB-dependent stress response